MNDRKRRQKRRRKIAQSPNNIRFGELRALLEDYGFDLKRTKGSHHSFIGYVGDEKVSVVIPYHRPLKSVYVKRVLKLIDEIEQLDTDSEEVEESDDD
jgi:predicted RNA binding protein YcfA (HicA-like mRNA interferase family)